jgi:hypothetical protein
MSSALSCLRCEADNWWIAMVTLTILVLIAVAVIVGFFLFFAH